MRNIPAASVAIIAGAAVLLSLSMGIRQSLGILMDPLTDEIAISVSEFTFAIAMQNLIWGITQPFVGALSVRTGFRPVMLAGAVLYVLGLVFLALAEGNWAVMLGAGVMIGIALSCAGPALTMSVASRTVPPAQRSMILGILSAAGSVGAMIAAPIGQSLATGFDWRWGAASFVVLALAMIPAALLAGRSDRMAIAAPPPGGEAGTAFDALRLAAGQPAFVVMACAYFVCGMQLVFITTHLPAYLAICGMDPMLSASALGTIGLFNALGSLFFGWAGGRWNKLVLLGLIYIGRSIALGAYFWTLPTPESTIVFAAVMGFLWLGVAPLVAGSVADMFGLKWQAMLQGVAFFGHQIGSFVGAFGGGSLFDAYGNYTFAWQIGVGLGLLAGVVQITSALTTPDRRPPMPQPI